MNDRGIFEELAKAVLLGDSEVAKTLTEKALAAELEPLAIINEGLSKGMDIVGKKFEDFEIFLPEVMLAVDAMNSAMAVLRPKLLEHKEAGAARGKVVIGTVYGDIHDIGKNLVATMLSVAGFEVYDLGSDVKVLDFVKKAEEVDANVIAMSTLLMVSAPYQRDVIRVLEDKGFRGKYFVLIGGGASTLEWAENIRADGWGKSAVEAVALIKRFFSEKLRPPLEKPVSASRKA